MTAFLKMKKIIFSYNKYDSKLEADIRSLHIPTTLMFPYIITENDFRLFNLKNNNRLPLDLWGGFIYDRKFAI
jgi:hypothetical protein